MPKSKFTKLLCLVLSLLMILGAAPIAASAAATTPDYLYVRNLGDEECTITWNVWGSYVYDSIWYSFDKKKTTAWDDAANVTITLGASGTSDDTVYFKGLRSADTKASNYLRLKSADNNSLEAGGDITTLLNCSSASSTVCGNVLDLSTDSKYSRTFEYKFSLLRCLKKIDDLKLPSTKLADRCYSYMFNGCEALTSIPEDLLPATTLADSCYRSMFSSCIGLTSIPEKLLSTTNLAANCYNNMFNGCSSLITVPEKLLPATTLALNCYQDMFYNCQGLTTIPKGLLPATTLAEACYREMFAMCSALTTVPKDLLPATTLTPSCYRTMFGRCSALTQAPDLPAQTLVTECYNSIFDACSNLSSLRVNFPAWATGSDSSTQSLIPTSLNEGVNLEFCCPASLQTTTNSNKDILDSVKSNVTFKSVYTASVTAQNGTAALDRLLYTNGDEVTVTVQPIDGYQVTGVTVNSGAVEATKKEKNVYTFTMPTDNAAVSVTCAPHTHVFDTAWTTDAVAHWHACTTEECPITSYATCGIADAAYGAHTLVDGACSVCGKVFVTFTANDNVLTATTTDETPAAYTLTLNENGTISAAEVAAWQAAGLTLPEIKYDTAANTASVTVRDATATVTLADDALTAHTVKVICGADENGKSYLTDVEPGTAVSVTAGTYEGKAFEKWNAKLNVNGSTAETVTFTMPNEDVTVEAEFVDCYPLSVFDGTTLTSEPQKVNYSATVTAPATPEGMRFIGWTAEGITLTDPTASALEFTMPANAVMLTANYAALHTVTVESGTVTGAGTTCQAIAGETISVTADTVSGHNFTGWTGEGVEFANAANTVTTFTMPESDVTVTANYEQIKAAAPAAGTAAYTYNGSAQTYAFANEGDVSYYELTGDALTQTEAGTYTIKASLTVDGTAWADGTTADKEYTFVIARQPVEKPMAYDTEYTYDGAEKSFILCQQIGSGYYYYESCIPAGSVTIANDTRTNAGTQTVTATPTANYCWADGTTDTLSFEFTVKRYAIPVLFDDSRDFTYDGTAHTYTPFVYMDGSIYDLDGLFYDLTGRTQTAAGRYTVTAELKDNFCWYDGTTGQRNFSFEIEEKKIESYIYYIEDLTTGELTTRIDFAYTIYDDVWQLKGFESHKKPETEMLKDRYRPYLVNAPEGSEVTFFITENRDPETMQIGARDWDYVKMSELKPDTVYYAFAVVSHPDYEYAQMTEITDCCRFHTPSILYTLVTKEEVSYEIINETQAFDVISAFMEGGYNGIIGSFFTGSEEASEIVKIKVQRFTDLDAAVLQGINDIEEGLDYAAISFELWAGHTYFYDMTEYNVDEYKAALGLTTSLRSAPRKMLAAPADPTLITGISDEPSALTATLLNVLFPTEAASLTALDNVEFRVPMDPELALEQLEADNEALIARLKDKGLEQKEGLPEDYISTVTVNTLLYDPETDCLEGASTAYEIPAGEMLPADAVKEIAGYTFDGLYYENIFDFELAAKDEAATGDHGMILTQGVTGFDPETDNITRDLAVWAIYVKTGTEEPIEYKTTGTVFSDADSEATVTLPAIIDGMTYGDVINDNEDITVSAVNDGKVTVTTVNDITGTGPLTFKVLVNANKAGIEDPFYYIIVTVNAIDETEVKAEAKEAIEALADDAASDEVKAIVSNAVAALEDANSVEAVNAVVADAKAAVAAQKAAEETPDEPEDDGRFAPCENRVTGFCNVYNNFRLVPGLNFIFYFIHVLIHLIKATF